MSARRLPVYFIVDCSVSATERGGELARRTLDGLLELLRGDPQALETVFASVIAYSDAAKQLCPLTELLDFTLPPLHAGQASALGAAFHVLDHSLETEVRKSSPTQKGDWKPVVFLLIGSRPTDEWESIVDRVLSRRPAAIVAVVTAAIGSDVVGRITDVVLDAAELPDEALTAFFRWVSTSISALSTPLELPDCPPITPIP